MPLIPKSVSTMTLILALIVAPTLAVILTTGPVQAATPTHSPGDITTSGSDATYGFPYHNPLLATILSVINRAALPYVKFRVLFHPERANLPGLTDDPSIAMGLFQQPDKAAPLVFVIAGTGGDGLSGSALLLASQLSRLGYHAITLPNPLSSQYVIGLSNSTLPGYLPNDSQEYYNYLISTVEQLRIHRHLQISGFSMVGVSYGATLAAFLHHVDQRRKVFRFEKTVMLNPPLDVAFSSEILDWYHESGNSIYPQEKFNIFQKFRELCRILLGHLPNIEGEDAKYTYEQVERLALDNVQMRWMIGSTFRSYLQSIVFTSQQIRDRGLLRSRAPADRLLEARKFGFADYTQNIVASSLGVKNEPVAIRQFLRRTSFYGLIDELVADPGAYIMENADDFLLRVGDEQLLKKRFGARLFLYPWGGHIGNIRYLQNQRDFAKIFGRAPVR